MGFDVAKAKLDYSLINQNGIELTSGKVANEELAIATIFILQLKIYTLSTKDFSPGFIPPFR